MVIKIKKSKYCNDNCKYLSITEARQNLKKVKLPHYCLKFKKQVKHKNQHPLLLKLKECLI